MSTIAVFLPPSITESFEIVLARACDLHDNKEIVTLVYCTGDIRGCVGNPYGWSSLCKHCSHVTEHAIAEVLPSARREIYCQVTQEGKLQGAAAQTIQDGPRSTILTFYRQDIRKLNWSYKNAIFLRSLSKRFTQYETLTYLFAKELLGKIKPKRVEYFNGRITPTMSISQAAMDTGVAHCAVEVSGFDKNFFFAHNTKVHDLVFLKGRMKKYAPSVEAKEVGRKFFQNKRSGIKTNDKVYTKSQSVGLFGESLKKTVAIFLSSTDEVEVFGDDWFTRSSRDPAAFVIGLRDALDPLYEVVVRMHPNQAGDKTGMAEKILRELSAREGITLIKPTDKHSSYELIDLACAVITFGSTVGFEATYWGKPSILAGRSPWEGEGVSYISDSAADAAQLIISNPAPLEREKAVKVAAYYMDKLDDTINLSYQHGKGLFKVKGLNFLPEKRKSISYKVNRALDKFLIR